MLHPTFDPYDIDAIRRDLEQHLAKLGPIKVIDGPARFTTGLDTYVYGFGLAGSLPPGWADPLVLRVFPAMNQHPKAEREFAIQEFVVSKGFPAPEPLELDVSGEPWGVPFMIMKRAPGAPAINRFKNPFTIAGTVRAMALLQARLHLLPTHGCPLPYDSPLVDRWLDRSRKLVAEYKLGLDVPMRWLEENAALVRNEEPVLTHNDFHPLNLLVDGSRMTLLDWPDAALGDRHCDVARTLALFWLASAFESSAVGRFALRTMRGFIVRRYEKAYAAQLPLDPERLRYWQVLHAFTAWAQIATMKQEGEEAIGAREGVLSEIPAGLIESLREYIEERMV